MSSREAQSPHVPPGLRPRRKRPESLFDPLAPSPHTLGRWIWAVLGAFVFHALLIAFGSSDWRFFASQNEPDEPEALTSEWVEVDFPEPEPPPPKPEPVPEPEPEVVAAVEEPEPVPEEPEPEPAPEEPEPEPEPQEVAVAEEPEPEPAPEEPEATEVAPIELGFEMSSESVALPGVGEGPAVAVGSNRQGRPARRAREPNQRPARVAPEGTGSGAEPPAPRRRARADDRERPAVRREVRAEYPEMARRRGLEANVVARVVVGEDGRVESVRVISSTVEGFGFEEAAAEALERFEFLPATRGGEPISMPIRYTYRFRLD